MRLDEVLWSVPAVDTHEKYNGKCERLPVFTQIHPEYVNKMNTAHMCGAAVAAMMYFKFEAASLAHCMYIAKCTVVQLRRAFQSSNTHTKLCCYSVISHLYVCGMTICVSNEALFLAHAFPVCL